VTESVKNAGYFRSGVPYCRAGRGPQPFVIFQGLQFEHKPPTGFAAWYTRGMYKFLEEEYTVYLVTPKPGLPAGTSMRDMANDYAVMIREEIGGPVDVMGTSTGGSIVQHFAADHPDLVRRLIIHSSAHTLGEVAKKAQMETGRLARQGKWREAYAVLFDCMAPRNILGKVFVSLGSFLMSLSAPKDPSDLVVTVEAEDHHNFKDRLGEIKAPTLVVAGDKDPFYTEALFRETAEGIPNARLILYAGMGHPAGGKQFRQDVLAFLKDRGRV
jgi:pimeloyl-ACP methyl ester carboxylesterase